MNNEQPKDYEENYIEESARGIVTLSIVVNLAILIGFIAAIVFFYFFW